jgi:hypothetical protein
VLLLGSAEVLKPQLSSTDLQFLENRRFSRAEICAAFGVPEEIVTSTEHAKYDVMAGARLNFIENRVAPLCSRLEAEEELTVRAIEPEASGWFDLDSLPIMQEARRNRLAAARSGFELGVPFNELNRVLDLGFKPLPWGDEGFVAAGLQKLGAAKSENGGATFEAGIRTNTTQSESAIQEGEGVKSNKRLEDLPTRAERWLDKARSERTARAAQAATLDALLSSKLRRFLFEQRTRVLTRLAAQPAGGGTPEDFVSGIFDLESEDEYLRKRVAAGETPAATAGLNQELRARLISELGRGLLAQESPEALAARVKAIYNRASDLRFPICE